MGQNTGSYTMTTYPLGLHSPYITKGAKGLLKKAVLLLIKDLHQKHGELTQEEKDYIMEIGEVLHLRYDSPLKNVHRHPET